MYQFAVVALLGLATLKVTDLLEELGPKLAKLHTPLVFVIGTAGTVWIHYSVFGGFHVALRETWMGPFFTGLIVSAMVTVWDTVFGWLGSEESHGHLHEHKPGRPQMAA